jgi:hypothetical protein
MTPPYRSAFAQQPRPTYNVDSSPVISCAVVEVSVRLAKPINCFPFLLKQNP